MTTTENYNGSMLNHKQVGELLPWYVTQSLVPEERAHVKAHLGECLKCRRELSALQALSELTQYSEDFPLNPKRSFHNLMARIDSDPASKKNSPRINLSGWMNLALKTMKNQGSWNRSALGLQFLVIIMLTVALVWPNQVPQENQYQTLSASEDKKLFPRAHLRILFKPDTTQNEMQKLLTGIQARIVDGPSAKGLYQINISPDIAAGNLPHYRNLLLQSPVVSWVSEPLAKP